MARRGWRQRLGTAIAGSLTMVMLTACGGSGAASPRTDTASTADQADSGGTLTYLEPQAWSTLYPPAAGFYPNGAVLNNIADRLLYQNPQTLELEPWIATALPEVNEDATEYTFTLRADVTYSDGTALTAANVVRNFELYGAGDPDRALTISEAINNYERGEAIDETTVRFHFSAPSPGFAQAVSTINSGLLSDATLQRDANGFGPGNAAEIHGSGPFVVVAEDIGTKLTLEAREDYDWAPPSLEHQGRARVDHLLMVVAGENSVRTGSLVSGQAHIARQIEAPDEQVVTSAGLTILSSPTNGVNNGLNLRFRHPLLEDVRVRQAIIAGIDRESIVQALYTDSYPLATGPLAETAQGYTDQSEHYVHDPAKAASLLAEAGWTQGSDGVLSKDGQRLSVTFNVALPLPRPEDVLTMIQDQLGQLGIEVSIISGDQAAQNAAAFDLEQVQIYHQMVGRAEFDVIKSQWHSENRNVLLNGDAATGTVADPELDRLLSEVASQPDAADRAAASAAAQDHLSAQAYVLPLFEEPVVYGVSAAAHGFGTESVGRPSFYPVWLDG